MSDEVTLNIVDEPTVFSLFGERLQGETFVDYKLRQKQVRAKQKQLAKGKLVWDSRTKGQYIKEKHGEL